MSIKITEECTGCGQCIAQCPYDAIEVKDNQAIILDNCNLCGACEDSCPVGAIIIDKKKEETKDLSAYKDVWVYGEQRDGQLAEVVYELIGAGKKLAHKLQENLCVVLPGHDINRQAEEIINYGVDKVYVLDNGNLQQYNDEYYTTAVTNLINSYKPSIILLGATTIGRSLGPRIAARIQTGLTADCTGLDIDEDNKNLLQTRPAFGGNIMATIVCKNHRPQMATVRAGVMQAAEKSPGYDGEIINHEVKLENIDLKTKILEVAKEAAESMDISEAEIIVSGGRGVGSGEDFEIIEKLADTLGGAVGASRAAVDSGWISQDHQVGQTGTTVSPKIYIACGISGAVQHIVGMEASDIIIAINEDPEAPIFNHATYGLVGDLFEIIPALIDEIEQVKSK